MKAPLTTFLLICLCLLVGSPLQANDKPRLIVLTDMGADPDDQESLVRLLLYSNQIDIQGLIATTSCWQQNRIRPDFIESILKAYEHVQPCLRLHEPDFPEPSTLRARVKAGSPKYGMTGVGTGLDTEGSEWILQQLRQDDPRPLWISVWGGVNTLAQALHKLKASQPADEVARLIARLRVYTISDQDDSGAWLRKTFPDLFYIVSPGDHYGPATWIGINKVQEGIDNTSISNPWISRNIQQGHGPLGACYPDVAWGMEGDTPSFLGIIPNGLNAPDRPDWGGWGGRYELNQPDPASIRDGSSIVVPEPETRPIWTDTSDTWVPYVAADFNRAVKKASKSLVGAHATLLRWREDFQNDFAARMDWCTKEFEQANHPPMPRLNHPENLTVKSGAYVSLDAYGSTDPDGDSISYLWIPYPEAGTYKGSVDYSGVENTDRFGFTAPKVDRESTVHVILRVTDKGTPSLSRYKRVIITILP